MSIKFAHTKEETLPDEWQELDVHCENVARREAEDLRRRNESNAKRIDKLEKELRKIKSRRFP